MLLLVLEQLEEYYKNRITCGKLLAKNHVYRKNIRKQEKTGVKKNVLFSDEMNVEVDSRKNRVMRRRAPHEKMHPDCSMYKTKQGGGV